MLGGLQTPQPKLRHILLSSSSAMSLFRRHLPHWGQVIPVYGMIAIVLYSWTLMRFFWKLPSWLYFLNGGEILGSLAYLLVINFLESLVFLCGPLFLAFVLPKGW